MVEIDVPGYRRLGLEYIVLDFNGTIAFDGQLISGVADRLAILEPSYTIYVITADTFGTVREQVKDIARVEILTTTDHREEKAAFVRRLGAESVVAMGNGRNDVAMLKTASLGIAVCQGEGAATEVVKAAEILCHDIRDALDLLIHHKRLIATLRA